MSETFEAVKTVGALLGFLSPVFLVFDRMIRGRPTASLTSALLWQYSESKEAGVRISNTSAFHDVAILDIATDPNLYHLMPDHETESIVKSVLGGAPVFFVLKPNESKVIWLGPNNDGEGISYEKKDHRFKIKVYWRNSTTTWLPQLPLTISTDTQTIRKYKETEDWKED